MLFITKKVVYSLQRFKGTMRKQTIYIDKATGKFYKFRTFLDLEETSDCMLLFTEIDHNSKDVYREHENLCFETSSKLLTLKETEQLIQFKNFSY